MTPPAALQQLPVEGPYSQRAFALWCVEQLPESLGGRAVDRHCVERLLRDRLAGRLSDEVLAENGREFLQTKFTVIYHHASDLMQLFTKVLTPGYVWRWTTVVDVFELTILCADLVRSELAAEAFAAICDPVG